MSNNKQIRLTTDFLNSPFNRLSVGLDRMFEDMMANPSFGKCGGYPPFNILKAVGEDNTSTREMVFAVAGFTRDDITISQKGNLLRVEGSSPVLDREDEVEYLHKGIAERNFTHDFTMPRNFHVQSAELKDGMLKIVVQEVVPESDKVKTFDIK